ncbi:MAG: hypothetical protein ACJZ2G_07485 [Thalassobaculaceae bacterium]
MFNWVSHQDDMLMLFEDGITGILMLVGSIHLMSVQVYRLYQWLFPAPSLKANWTLSIWRAK